jgi:teichuronic acid biosynthesis glycosyltransferase TuaC
MVFQSKDRIKILFLVSNYPSRIHPYRGVFFKKIAEGLAQNPNLTISVATPIPYSNVWIEKLFPSLKGNNLIPNDEVINGVNVFRPRYLRLPFLHQVFLSHYVIFSKVAKIIKKLNPDLIDFRTSYSPYPLSKIAVLLNEKFDIPYIYTINGAHLFPHHDKNKIRVDDFNKMIQSAKLVQAVSLELLMSVKIATSIEPILTVHPIDLSELGITESEKEIRQKWGLPNVTNYLFFAGQLSSEKGVDCLIDAFLKGDFPDTILLLAGDGVLMNSVESNNIYFLGKIENAEVLKLMKIATLFVFLTKFEGMPNVLKEAGAMKLPIITTKVGGIPELLNYGERGTIIENDNINTIIDAINFSILNPDIGISKAEKLYKHIIEEYDIVKTNQKLINTYKTILNCD